MKQWLNPLSVNPRLFGAGSIRKALRTIHRTAVRGIRVSTNSSHTLTASETLALDSTDYVGAFLFHGNSFSKYLFDGGYVIYSGSTPSLHFYLHDHQGNNRAVAEFATLSHVNASLSQTTYYYPYGGVFGDKGSYPDSQPYKYNGKELDRMHGLDWYDYGARQYDPAIARFTSMDPLAEKYYHISPYAYCAGNPVNYVDPDGRVIEIANGASPEFKRQLLQAFKFMEEKGSMDLVRQLDKRPEVVYLAEVPRSKRYTVGSGFGRVNNIIYWDPFGGLLTPEKVILSPATILLHEVDHALRWQIEPEEMQFDLDRCIPDMDNLEEWRAIENEWEVAIKHGEIGEGEITRASHRGTIVNVENSTSTTIYKDKNQ